MNNLKRLHLTVFALILSVIMVSVPVLGHAQSADSVAWRQDLAFLARELPDRHINAFHTTSQDDFEAAVADLDAAIPDLSYAQFVVRLMQLVASVGDSHTVLAWNTMGDYALLPVQMAVYPDGVYVIAADRAYKAAVRGRLVAIEDVPVDQVIARLSTVVSYENEQWQRRQTGNLLGVADILVGLDILSTRNGGTFTFETENRETIAFEVSAIPVSELQNTPLDIVVSTAQVTDPPTYWYYSRVSYGYERLADGAFYVAYNRCASDPDYPVDQFIADVLAEIDAGGVDAVIIDLRRNTGGDSRLLEPLITGLQARDTINQPGHLYVLIGPDVYSSAVLNAFQFRRDTAAILVGEPTGQPPNHYGETGTLELPNTGLTVTYATNYFVYTEDDADALYSDVLVVSTAQDLFAGRDPVLVAVLAELAQ